MSNKPTPKTKIKTTKKKPSAKASKENINFEPTKVAFLVSVISGVSIILFVLMSATR